MYAELTYRRIYNKTMMKDERSFIKEAQSGNIEALDELIKQNNGLIWSIVKRFLGRSYEKDDLYQIGCIGFIKSIKRFDINYGYKLSTFAVPYIVGEIKKFFRDDGIIKVSRSIKELGIKVKEIREEYLKKNGEKVTVKKISEILNVDEDSIFIAIDATRQVESINEEIFDNENKEKIEKISVKTDEQSKIVDRLTVINMINELDNREKIIIRLRYFNEKTQTQVAKILGISQVQVSRIEKKILGNMREKMVGG